MLCTKSLLFFGLLRSHSSDFGNNAFMKLFSSIVVLCASRSGLNVRRAACFVAVAFALGATSVASAQADQSGPVRAWGFNNSGQCNIPSDLGVCTQIAGGSNHTIAIQQSGLVRAWGYNGYGQCDIPSDLGVCTQIAGGGNHTIAIQNPDCNANGIDDYLEYTGNDCDNDGVLNSCEMASGTSDCNSNGIPDSCEPDADSDETIDSCDGCPNDPHKTSPGVCGCGTADTDTDSDGTANCFDDDDDNDGVLDGADGCPLDLAKSEPGVCGCGTVDTDSDGDGTADCIESPEDCSAMLW